MNLYQEHILENYKNPKNIGEIAGGRHASEQNTLCGDEIDVYVDAEDHIDLIKHQTKGCAITVASASILSDVLIGKTVEEISNLTEDDVLSILKIELTPARIKCAMLPVWALKQALNKEKE